MAEIPEPIITETEALEVASEKIDKKKKIIKRKSPKSNNATTNKSSSASDITNNAPDTSLDGILAGESSVKEKKKRSVSKKVDKNTNADVIIDTSYLRVANEKLVLELKQDLTKLNKAKELLRTIDFAHDTLFKSNENISGLAAFNDITNFLFIKLLKPYLSDTTDNGKIDLFNLEHYKNINAFKKDESKLPKLFTYFQDMNKLLSVELQNLRNPKAYSDTIRDMGKILKAHPITGQIFQDENIINIKTPELVQSFLKDCILDPPLKTDSKKNIEKEKENENDDGNENVDVDVDLEENIEKETKETDKNKDTKKKNKKKKQSNIIDVNNLYNIEDGIGILYENFNSKYLNDSKGQGQFFTPRTQMDMSVEFTKPLFEALLAKKKANNQPFRIGDFCMGTGGWIITIYNMFKQEYGDLFEIYGGDVNPRTFQMGLMNIIITMHKLPKPGNVVCASSLTNVSKEKMDVCALNPPFITDMPFKVIREHFNNFQDSIPEEQRINISDVYKLSSNSAPIQFTELAIYKLEDDGIGIIVYPNGDLFFGSNEGNIQFRKYLLDTVDLKAIITFPGGIYGHTSIKTIVLIFIKDSKGTSETAFLRVDANSNKQCEKMYEIAKVKKADFLKHPNVSYKVEDYIKEETFDYGCNVEVKKLGDVCEFQNGKNITTKELVKGDYPVVGGGKEPLGYHNKFNVDENTILISKDGAYAGYVSRYNNKVFVSNHGIYINEVKSDIVLRDFIYYYMKHILQPKLYKLQTGAAQPGVNKNNIEKLEIPIPHIQMQSKFVNYFDTFIENTETINKQKIKQLQECINTTIGLVQHYNDIEVKKLGDVCDLIIGGTPSTKELNYYHNGKNLWVSVKELNNNIITDTNKKLTDLGVQKSNVKLIKKGTILFSFKLSIGKIAIAGADLYTNEAIAGLVIKDNTIIDNKYLYYYLSSNDYSKKGSGLIGNGSLNKESLSKLEIPIPPLEKQQKIVAFCDTTMKQIKELEDEIAEKRQMALEIFNEFLKSKTKIDETILEQDTNEAEIEHNQEELLEEQLEDELGNIDS
jgi:restriction endonuclease S subunit